jgi:hypothetical protein
MNKKLLFVFFAVFCLSQSLLACIPSITIQTSTGSLNFCTANTLSLTSTVTDGGALPTFQWYKNGVAIVGAINATFSMSGNTILVGDQFTCELTSNAACASPAMVVSNVLALNVTLAATPSLAITANPATGIACAGANVLFLAPGSALGSAPIRQWKINGVNVGTNSFSYSSTSLANGDIVSCSVISNATCVTTNVITSNTITMTINPSVVPVVAIISPNAVGCSVSSTINFTANSINGGAAPAYSWYVNGVAAGVTGTTFNSTTVVNGDIVNCRLTSNAFCAVPNKDTSNDIAVTVLPTVTPTISISVDNNPTCGSIASNFTATITNGGSAPSFQWKINGNNTGSDTSFLNANYFNNGDVVNCVLTSNVQCASISNPSSNSIVMSITPAVTPSISIVSSPGNSICFGQTVTYTATITNGGSLPNYIWKVNGVIIPGNNIPTFTSSTIPNGSLINVLLTSNAACVTAANATSNSLPLTVKPLLTPSIAILGNKTSICFGSLVNFASSTTVSGFAPTFQWKVNGNNVGGSTSSFNTTALPVGINTITCTMTSSSNQCLTASIVNSNQFIVNVDPVLTPDITIVASSNNVCFGTPITFTSSTISGGATPIYTWKINGITVGGNNAVITSTNLNNGDLVYCILTSSETCVSKAKDSSAIIQMLIKPLVTPQVVTKQDTDYVCQNDLIVFSVTNTFNGGITPIYQWYKNGLAMPNNGLIFSSSTFVNGDIVYCTMTSSAECPNPPIDTSTKYTIHIYAPAVPNATIASNDTVTCIGTNIIFTATVVDAGSAPYYQWYWNGLPHGPNSNIYPNTLLETNDSVYVVMTSNAPCLTKPNDTSNAIKMTVIDNITPIITLTQSINAGAIGTPIVYTATTSVLPNYNIQWYRNNALMTTTNNINTWSTTIANSFDSVYAKIINFTGCYLAASANSPYVKLGALGIGGFTPANFIVYPNPIQNLATIEGVAIGDELILYDMTGKVVVKTIINKMDTYQLDMSAYANGIYQAKFIRGNQNWVVRLQKN